MHIKAVLAFTKSLSYPFCFVFYLLSLTVLYSLIIDPLKIWDMAMELGVPKSITHENVFEKLGFYLVGS